MDIKRNHNKDFTLIARDCVGGVLYHQLKLKFQSPTINLFFEPEDFNLFCLNLQDYLDGEIVELKDSILDYPVGLLSPKKGEPIKIHFMHYASFKEAADKWDERKKRINWNNLYVMSTMCYPKENAMINDKLIKDWNQIPYRKVMLVDKHYGFDNEFVINKPAGCDEYAWLLYEPDKADPERRVFNDFDFINFLNNKKSE